MAERPLSVVFAGTPEFAAKHLKALIESEYQLLAVYTQPDRPAGRGRRLQASPVKMLATQAGLDVRQPGSLRDEAVQAQLAALRADVMVVVAYGLILPQAVLDTPRLGCLNVHASLLPRWRGAAPIQRAIEAGDTVSGITIMQMDAGLDTGAILATAGCPIDNRTDAAALQDRLAELGPPLLLDVLGDIARRQRNCQAQNEEQATYAHKIHKSEAEIAWAEPAQVLDRKIRAFCPAPVCYTMLANERIRIWRASPSPASDATALSGTIVRADGQGIAVRCGEGDLVLETVQLEGGKALSVQQLMQAHQARFRVGARFGSVVVAAPE